MRRERSDDHRCHLDCEIVWVPDDELDGDLDGEPTDCLDEEHDGHDEAA
jgi:hypothetical protein